MRSMPVNSIVDIIGIVTTISNSIAIHRKNRFETIKIIIHVKDMSSYSIDVTLWGEHCHIQGKEISTLFSVGTKPILAIKGGRVAEFNGKTIGTMSKSIVLINPNIQQRHKLQMWLEKEGLDSPCSSLTTRYANVPIHLHKK